MGLHDGLEIARKRWRVVLLGLLCGLFVAIVVTWLTPREYSAQVTIYVSAQSGDNGAADAYQGSLLSEQKVKSYTRLLAGTLVAQRVVDRLRLDIPAAEVASKVQASAQPETVLLTVTVTDGSPVQARNIADAAGEVFTGLVTELEQPAENLPATVTARVVEQATVPTDPVTPRTVTNLSLGLLLGLVAGAAFALLWDALDTTIKSTDQLAQLTGAPNLGTITRDPDMPGHPLTAHESPHAPRAEAFRKIRTSLQFIDVDRPNKTIVVTSALAEEGKTTVLCNLAIVLSQADRRVVLVETDLRRPRAVDYLGLEGGVGVTSVLAGQVSLDQALQPWGGSLFAVLASGPTPPNPSELLGSRQMLNLMAELRERYDTVLLDTPPLLPVTDAAVLGAAADGVLLVVRYGKTTTHQVKTAMAALETASVRLLGTAFTMVPEGAVNRYEPYYSRYYGEKGTDEDHSAPAGRVPAVFGRFPPPERARRSNGNGTTS
ncbi:polysaccharide biosynthesis tyrosine autokinase [Amycolatopsis sp. NPDC051128]|uniref:polysaccharide biosynthesis tyrosine autokinase n=1 Tax=Amycolatopsis sp. NPDC051128 TaxID=3155412 RepID=UPI003426A803